MRSEAPSINPPTIHYAVRSRRLHIQFKITASLVVSLGARAPLIHTPIHTCTTSRQTRTTSHSRKSERLNAHPSMAYNIHTHTHMFGSTLYVYIQTHHLSTYVGRKVSAEQTQTDPIHTHANMEHPSLPTKARVCV